MIRSHVCLVHLSINKNEIHLEPIQQSERSEILDYLHLQEEWR